LFAYYSEHLAALFSHHPTLEKNFENSIWPAATFNLGPQTVCVKHRDAANLAYGWCAITALGNFNPARGGHLILWDMKLVVEFPPGATLLIPSSVVLHSNTKVQDGEERMSFTQYAAGGLFRWVDNNFQTAKMLESVDPEGKKQADERAVDRWQHGLQLFQTFESLLARIELSNLN
jgi:hypothetical protein